MNSDNNECGNAMFCVDCGWKTTDADRAICRAARLRLLTAKEQDVAVEKGLTSFGNPIACWPHDSTVLSERTKILIAWDSLCAAQDYKTMRCLENK